MKFFRVEIEVFKVQKDFSGNSFLIYNKDQSILAELPKKNCHLRGGMRSGSKAFFVGFRHPKTKKLHMYQQVRGF